MNSKEKYDEIIDEYGSWETYTKRDISSKIEHAIIKWYINETKTSGTLTREIMNLIKENEKK